MVRCELTRRYFDWQNFSLGARRFMVGMCMKVLVADTLSPLVDVAGVKDGFDLVDVIVEHRQARALGLAQLLDQVFDWFVEVKPFNLVTRDQDVIDRDVVQRMNACEQVRPVVGLLVILLWGAQLQPACFDQCDHRCTEG